MKRRTGDLFPEDLYSNAKRTQMLAPGSSAWATTSPPAANMVPEAGNKANGLSITENYDSVYIGTPTTSKVSFCDGSLKVHGFSPPHPTPPRAAQPVTNFQDSPTTLPILNSDPSCTPLSRSSVQNSGSEGGPKAQESNETTKTSLKRTTEMLKYELDGKVHTHDKNFEEFPESNQEGRNHVLKRVRNQASEPSRSLGQANCVDDNNNNQWILNNTIKTQKNEGEDEPLSKALNVDGEAAFDTYLETHPNDTIHMAYFSFVNSSPSGTQSDFPSDGTPLPDLLQDERQIDWSNYGLIVGNKSTSTPKLHNDAYIQLSRYSRALFKRQTYRVPVFGPSLHGLIVNLVYFDLCGMLYSPNLNLSRPDEAGSFIQSINLMALDASKYGYDDRYSFDYLVNPPRTHFKFQNCSLKPVDDVICRRIGCYGRATWVTGLRELLHKTTSRPKGQIDEGTHTLRFGHVFGVRQLRGTSNARDTRLKYVDELDRSATISFFSPQSSSLNSSEILRDVRLRNNLFVRRGTSLFGAQSPLHLVLAIHDAVLAVMMLTEAGRFHRDISSNNLLLVDPNKHHPNQIWPGQPKCKTIPGIWRRTARGSPEARNESNDEGQETNEYESPPLKRIRELGRGPYCVLYDTEFTVDETSHEDDGKDPHINRTGTPTFISAQLLITEVPINRMFMHDIESLFWVLLWVIAHRSQKSDGSWQISKRAQELIRGLSDSNMKRLGAFKKSLFDTKTGGNFGKLVMELENPWCEDLAGLVEDLGRFLYYYLYYEGTPRFSLGMDDPGIDVERQALLVHDRYLDQTHQKTFDDLFKYLDRYTRVLEQKFGVDLTDL